MDQLSITTRPRKFEEILGQPAVVKSLQNNAKKGTWPRAMLFEGPSGTGKTSAAQLVAMMINCTAHDQETVKRVGAVALEIEVPCGKCPSCQSIIQERFDSGTLRLNGTATSKDEVVDFLDLARGTSLYAKNSIFIIEEADGLSPKAREAMLKALEHPGQNVYFLLLSMVRNGMGKAIQDRCQKLVFNPLGIKDTMLGLRELMKRGGVWDTEGVPKTFYSEVIPVICEAAEGSLRGAVSMVQSCLSAEVYTKEQALTSLQISGQSTVVEILKACLDLDIHFFEKLETMEFRKFFTDAVAALAGAASYRVTGVAAREYYQGQDSDLSKRELIWKLLEIFEDCQRLPYPSKPYFIGRVARFFGENQKRRIDG